MYVPPTQVRLAAYACLCSWSTPTAPAVDDGDMSKKRPRPAARRTTPPAVLCGTLLAALLIAVFGRPLPSIAAAVIIIAVTTDPSAGRRLLELLPRWPGL